MKNFYFKIPVSASDSVEVYVGQSSGKQIHTDIVNASHEVLIISPYIDRTRLDDLIDLNNRGIKVRLAFSDLRKEQEKDVLKKLISQFEFVDIERGAELKKKADSYQYILLLLIGLMAALLVFSVVKTLDSNAVNYTFLLGLPLLLGFFIVRRKKEEVENTDLSYFEYKRNIDFKYLRNSSWENDSMFIHSKIYIIDRKIAYLGSVNFTSNGFSSNFETRIRIVHRQKVDELVSFVNSIFDDDHSFRAHDVSYLGRKVYGERQAH